MLVTLVLIGSLLSAGCATTSSRIGEYLAGFQSSPSQPPSMTLPMTVGLLIALPENELSFETTPSKDWLMTAAQRIQKQLEESSQIRVAKIFPPIIIPAGGLGALSLERVRDSTKDAKVTKIITVVATSQPARKVRFWMIEDQLFVRMDAALVDVSQGQVLVTETGQDDYVLAQSNFYNAFSYPRLYYRTFTFAGPFTVVEGDPYKALGQAAFAGAADQIGMKLRQRLDPQPSTT
jgi:hypothetical protein